MSLLALLIPRLPAISGALLALLLAACVAWRIDAWRIDRLEVDLRQAREQLSGVTAANQTDEKTILGLQGALARWQALATPAAATTRDEPAIEAAAAARQAAAAALKTHEATDNAEPSCEALLAADLDRVCPAHALGVRQRAAYRVPGPPGPSPDAGSPAVAGVPDR